MEKTPTKKKTAKVVKRYATLDKALKTKNDEARTYLKNVKWPEDFGKVGA